ncbi:hypothetical protein QR680_014271 [Steinernema hermaphroditum]|uniref:Uncharacterized protein n=1 Tax=Steinernema hermaphroditum TaxID=289476 RepID=A0AA39IB13_9BILA|nr:hypothetical protein QR680_014271 [Steinernema hermaphroditum]
MSSKDKQVDQWNFQDRSTGRNSGERLWQVGVDYDKLHVKPHYCMGQDGDQWNWKQNDKKHKSEGWMRKKS